MYWGFWQCPVGRWTLINEDLEGTGQNAHEPPKRKGGPVELAKGFEPMTC